MTADVSCARCAFFAPYDQNSKDRLNGGKCRQYEHYKAKNLPDADINDIVRMLGGIPSHPVFSGSSVRDCKKFIEIESE